MSKTQAHRTLLALAVCFALAGQPVLGSEKQVKCDIAAAQDAARRLAEKYGGPGNVLVIFDADNTLLKSAVTLGSDQWFTWQSEMIGRIPTEGRSSYLVADNFADLIRIQDILHFLGSMVPPDPRAPLVVRELQNEGFSCMVCTSRGAETHDVLARELRRNGYEFGNRAPGPAPCGLFKPEGAAAEVSYDDGVFMTSGQNKGQMLTSLMKMLAVGFKAVVFVDDSAKNTDRVYEHLDAARLDVWTIRYSCEDNVVTDFRANRDGVQELVKAQWEKMKAVLSDIWGRTAYPQPALTLSR